MPVNDQNRTHERRRDADTEPHSTSIRLSGERMVVVCRCGQKMGGGREQDGWELSLSDILAMIRDHHTALNSGRGLG